MTDEDALFEVWFHLQCRDHWKRLYPTEPFREGWGEGYKNAMREGWVEGYKNAMREGWMARFAKPEPT